MMHMSIYSMLDLELPTGGIPDKRHDNHDAHIELEIVHEVSQ